MNEFDAIGTLLRFGAGIIFGVLLMNVFSKIKEWCTEEQKDVLEGLKKSGAYDFAQSLLKTLPGATVIGTVYGIKIQVTIFFLKNVVGDVLEPTFTWSEPPSEGINHMVSDDQGEFEVRPRHTEGRLRFERGVSKREMRRVREALIRALIIIREEEANDHQTKGESEVFDTLPSVPVSQQGE